MRYVYSFIVFIQLYSGALSWPYTTFVIRFKHGHYGAKLKCLIRRKPWRNIDWNGDSKRLTNSEKDMLHKLPQLTKSTCYTTHCEHQS